MTDQMGATPFAQAHRVPTMCPVQIHSVIQYLLSTYYVLSVL